MGRDWGSSMENLVNRCEHEKLHLSGEIQPHGALLCVNRDGVITHCSTNIETLLGSAPQAILGKSATTLFGESVLRFKHGNRRAFIEQARHANGDVDLMINSSDTDEYTIEVYAHSTSEYRDHTEHQALNPPQQEAEVISIRQSLLEDIAQLTGFQRIMFYQFVENNDGEVTAEFCQAATYGSYLGLRFPASDIPQIARNLYIKNPWRQIPHAAADNIAIIGLEQSVPDLSYCDLRSVSPMHKIYLANMGVSASLSFPIIINGTLIALVACHDYKPNVVPQAVLEVCRSRVNQYSLKFSAFSAYQRMRLVDGLNRRFQDIQVVLQRNGSLKESWNELAPWLLEEFAIDGVVLTHHNAVLRYGIALEDHVLDLVEQEFAQSSELVWSKDCLSRQLSSFVLSEVAGMMAIKIGSDRTGVTRLYLCRAEQIQEIAWGGSPEKPVEYHDGKLGISPRRSFAKWVEKRVGYSLPWDNKTLLLLVKLRELLSGTAYV
jgi:light-regulated signal transduction histidine kinase (bacteriophytochrome)